MKDVSELEDFLKIKFNNRDYLTTALTHRSYINEHPDFVLGHNERLEFLGDAVLEVIVTEYLYKNYENPEGDLTNWRASLVNAIMLSKLAVEIGLDDYLLLSRGEAKDKDSKARQYILANAIEALIGAIYLDQGIEKVKEFVDERLLTKLPYIIEHKLYLDPKSRFQEAVQDKLGVTPTYKVLSESGPDHAKVFKVGVFIGDEMVTDGEGTSKQEAQVQAAEKALQVKGW
jgi:ribonuclease-3